MIAQQLGVVAYPIDHPVEEAVDVLFLGGGVYMWNMDSSLRRYIKNLDAQKIGQIAAFSTYNCTKNREKHFRGKSQ